MSERVVLCGASAYEQKYYFNEAFAGMPPAVRDELRILCVLFTEEVGGVFKIVYEDDGGISLETESDETDYYYDEVSSGLMIGAVRDKRQELFKSLERYYRIVILHEEMTGPEE